MKKVDQKPVVGSKLKAKKVEAFKINEKNIKMLIIYYYNIFVEFYWNILKN